MGARSTCVRAKLSPCEEGGGQGLRFEEGRATAQEADGSSGAGDDGGGFSRLKRRSYVRVRACTR
eukprot:6171830-Pleurochrysis_carterae.AAC.1